MPKRKQTKKGPCGKRDASGFIEYIAEDDVRTSRGCSPRAAYDKFVQEYEIHPMRLLGVKSEHKGVVNAHVIDEFGEEEE